MILFVEIQLCRKSLLFLQQAVHYFLKILYLTNREALAVLCSVVKHTGSG